MTNIGFLGLGVMGSGMTGNILKKCGPEVTLWGYDPVEVARERFAQKGGRAAANAGELYEACEIIMMILPTNELLRSTVDEVLDTAKPGTALVDLGASSPYLVRELHDKALARGFGFLDAPVSGGKPGADAGTLVLMCGGEREVFDRVRPYLDMMGKTVTYMGSSGCGSMAKVANNMMVGIHMAAMGEAYALAVKAGLDPKTLFEAIKGGFAQSAVMDEKIPKVLRREFQATARTSIHLKDVNNAMEMAEHLGVDLPLSKTVREQMLWMKERGILEEDHCALVKYYEDAMGVTIE